MPSIGAVASRAARARALRAAAWCRPCSSRAAAATCRPRAAGRPSAARATPGRAVDAEHLVDAEVAPHLRQLVDLLDERLLPRGEERRVDAAGRDAGQDVGDGRRKFAREIFAARRPDTRRARRRRSARAPGPADWSAVAHQMLTHGSGLGSLTGIGCQRLRSRFSSKPAMMDLLRDLRQGFRLLRRAPGFAATAILTLALGIGATTALFTVVNAVLLEPLPFPDSEQADPGVAQRAAGADLWLGVVRALPRLAAAPARLHRPRRVVAARLHASPGPKGPERAPARWRRRRSSSVIGAPPVIGRYFSDDEDRRGRRTRRR